MIYCSSFRDGPLKEIAKTLQTGSMSLFPTWRWSSLSNWTSFRRRYFPCLFFSLRMFEKHAWFLVIFELTFDSK